MHTFWSIKDGKDDDIEVEVIEFVFFVLANM